MFVAEKRRWNECDAIVIVDDTMDLHALHRLDKRLVANQRRAECVDGLRFVPRGGQCRQRGAEAVTGHEERNVNVLECFLDVAPDDLECVFETSVNDDAAAEVWNGKIEIADQVGRFPFRAAEDQRRPLRTARRLHEYGLRVGCCILLVEECNLLEILWSEEFGAQRGMRIRLGRLTPIDEAGGRPQPQSGCEGGGLGIGIRLERRHRPPREEIFGRAGVHQILERRILSSHTHMTATGRFFPASPNQWNSGFAPTYHSTMVPKGFNCSAIAFLSPATTMASFAGSMYFCIMRRTSAGVTA